MSVQTTVDFNIREAIPGVLADISPMEKGSFAAEGGSIPFGIAVVRGTADNQAMLATGTGQVFLGLTIRTLDRVNENIGSNLSVYNEFDAMSVLRNGRIYATPVGVPVAVEDPVWFYHTANAGKVPGDLVNADDSGFTDLMPNATWDKDSLADEISIVRLKN